VLGEHVGGHPTSPPLAPEHDLGEGGDGEEFSQLRILHNVNFDHFEGNVFRGSLQPLKLWVEVDTGRAPGCKELDQDIGILSQGPSQLTHSTDRWNRRPLVPLAVYFIFSCLAINHLVTASPEWENFSVMALGYCAAVLLSLPSWCHFGLRQCRDQGGAYLVGGIKVLDGLWGPVHVPARFGVSLAVTPPLVVIYQPALG